jgi:hypothetical protein
MFQVFLFLVRWALHVLVWIKADKEAATAGAIGKTWSVAVVAADKLL